MTNQTDEFRDANIAEPATRPGSMGLGGAGDPVTAAAAGEALIGTLNGLIDACRDNEYGYNACAEHLEVGSVQRRFHQRAVECRDAARELANQVQRLGGTPKEGGTARGAMHRGWVAVRATLSGHGERAMLEECERGEDVALARYRQARNEVLPPDIEPLIQRQLLAVQQSHDDIKALRDEARSHA